ncbi:MAG: hypothetical protein ISR75_04790 [Phycisphaerales bacterium]|nr:hypothetical protein [Planctomycetota bacterium]MBL6997736.1 hypothetical protein [Phycisphaerales bacterium]
MLKFLLLCTLQLSLLGCESSEPNEPQRPISKPTIEEPEPENTTLEAFLEEEEEVNIKDRIDKFTNKPPKDKTHITFGRYRSKKPHTWAWVPPKSQAVTCNYVVPSTKTNEHALFSITEFTDGVNGTFDENVARWKSLFRSNDGSPLKPKVESFSTNIHDVKVAEFEGEYMGAGAAWHLQNHCLLIANIQVNGSSLQFKLLGSRNTVQAHRQNFINFIKEISPLPPPQE